MLFPGLTLNRGGKIGQARALIEKGKIANILLFPKKLKAGFLAHCLCTCHIYVYIYPFEINEYPLIKAVPLSGDVINRKGKVLGQITEWGRDCLGVGEAICIRLSPKICNPNSLSDLGFQK